VCAENVIRIDLVTESLNVSADGRTAMFLPDAVASPFKSRSRLEAENAALRHRVNRPATPGARSCSLCEQ
jgi:hypothetical protein